MLILLAIGFLAGVVTAVSPCVLPVLPILLAAGASGRKPLRIVAGLVTSFTVFTLFAAWLLDQLGLPDDFLRNAAIVLLFVLAATLLDSTRGAADRAAARILLAPAPGRRRRRVLPRRDARARLRALRRPGARDGHRRRGQRLRRTARDPADARVRRRSSIADAPDRPRRTGSCRPPAPARRGGEDDLGRTDRRRRVRSRLPPRRQPRDAHPRLHVVPAEQDRGQLHRETRAVEGARRRPGARGDRQDAGGQPAQLRRRTTSACRRCVDQHEAADARVVARQGRARRLLDVLLHQLPAHAASPQGLVRGVSREGARDHRRAHPGVRLRARDVERAGCRQATGHPLSRDAGQRLQDLGQLRERVLARRVPDRQTGARSPHALRRGRVPADRSVDPAAARRQRGARKAAGGRDAHGPADTGELPRVRTPRRTTSARARSRTSTTRITSPRRSPRTRSRTTAVGASVPTRSSQARTHAYGSATRRATCTSSSGATAPFTPWSTASRPARSMSTRSGSTRFARRRRWKRGCWSCGSRPASRRTRSRSGKRS